MTSPLPRWALLGTARSPVTLGLINRNYWHWYGRLRALRTNAELLSPRHRDAVQRIIDAELRDITNEFAAWKAANGYA